jgi:hypothetical protein
MRNGAAVFRDATRRDASQHDTMHHNAAGQRAGLFAMASPFRASEQAAGLPRQ